MKRIEFLKNAVGLFGVAHISQLEIKQYEKVYLKHFFVRGFQYYEGPNCIDEINDSGLIELVREPENQFDKRAIALYFNKKKIGFVPRESNKTLSILMDTELLEFHAEITHIEPKAEHWEQIRVAIYALKEIRSNQDWKKIEPYVLLKTPTYYSLKSEDDTLTRVKTNPIVEQEALPRFQSETYLQKHWNNAAGNDEASVVYYSVDSLEAFEHDWMLGNETQTTESLISQQEEDALMEKINFYYHSNPEFASKERYFVLDINQVLDDQLEITGIKSLVGDHGLPYFEVIFEQKPHKKANNIRQGRATKTTKRKQPTNGFTNTTIDDYFLNGKHSV